MFVTNLSYLGPGFMAENSRIEMERIKSGECPDEYFVRDALLIASCCKAASDGSPLSGLSNSDKSVYLRAIDLGSEEAISDITKKMDVAIKTCRRLSNGKIVGVDELGASASFFEDLSQGCLSQASAFVYGTWI